MRLDNGNTYTYDTERANNFELTWRGQFMDGRLNVNTSVFYQDWDNQQVEIWEDPTDPLTSIITNAGASTSYGGEFELSYQASDNLSVYAGVGLLHTEFKDFEYNGADLSGQPFSNAPEQTFVLGIVYGQGYGWYATGNVKYVGSALSRIESGGARGELGGYTTVDAEVGYTFDNGFRFAAYATNLFDEQYFTYNASPAGTLASLGDRREVGIRLNKTF